MNILTASMIAIACGVFTALIVWVSGAGGLAVFLGYMLGGTVGFVGTLCAFPPRSGEWQSD